MRAGQSMRPKLSRSTQRFGTGGGGGFAAAGRPASARLDVAFLAPGQVPLVARLRCGQPGVGKRSCDIPLVTEVRRGGADDGLQSAAAPIRLGGEVDLPRAAGKRAIVPGASRRAAHAKPHPVAQDARRTAFFISYTGADRAWAEWIGFVLEERGFSVVIQAWDFRPGSNFVIEMQRAASAAARTIMVLSPSYLGSVYASPEWAAAFVEDPEGLKRKLVPVRIAPCAPEGLLKALVHIDLTGLDEAAARERLFAGLERGRAKPTTKPAFPGGGAAPLHPEFPGRAGGAPARPSRAAPYVPDLKGPPSDLEKRRFVKEAFETIAAYFESALPAVALADRHVDVEFQRESAVEFTAEIFRAGTTVAFCRVFRGTDFSSDGIGYSEGRGSLRNIYNEMLSIAADGGGLRLRALMGASYGRASAGLDERSLTSDQAAEYLWHRLVGRLER